MSIEDPQIQTETPAAKPTEVPAPARGSRGELGIATAGLTIRQQWWEAGKPGSLKDFARQQVKQGSTVAKEWFANKRGAKNQQRSDKSLQRIAAEKAATKASKRKTGKK